jgi:hypothetical protein
MIGGTRAGDRQESFMSLPHLRWSISALWISLALLMFTLAGNFSVRSWLYVIATTLVPPMVLLRLWSDGPPQTVAQVLRATEDRR